MRRRVKHERLDYDPMRMTMRFRDGTSFKFVLNRMNRDPLDFEVECGGIVRRFVEIPPADYDEWRND